MIIIIPYLFKINDYLNFFYNFWITKSYIIEASYNIFSCIKMVVNLRQICTCILKVNILLLWFWQDYFQNLLKPFIATQLNKNASPNKDENFALTVWHRSWGLTSHTKKAAICYFKINGVRCGERLLIL